MNYYAAFGMVFLFFGGMLLDNHYHTGIRYAMSGFILGIIYLAYEIWKAMRQK
jgi:hypothetical protein